MIHADDYRSLRQATARDVDEMVALTRRAVADGRLIGRTREEILAQLDDYWLLDMDHVVVGFAALHQYPDEDCAEIASLFIRPGHGRQGHGTTLVERFEIQAREAGFSRIFAFSTQAADFFVHKCGYEEENPLPTWLPAERSDAWVENGRKSRLLWKNL